MQRDVIFHPDSIKLDINSPAVFLPTCLRALWWGEEESANVRRCSPVAICVLVLDRFIAESLISIPFLWHRSESYHFFERNCNTFSNEVAQFLTGRKIPSYITDLPSEVLATWVCILLLSIAYCFMLMLKYLTEAAVPVCAVSLWEAGGDYNRY